MSKFNRAQTVIKPCSLSAIGRYKEVQMFLQHRSVKIPRSLGFARENDKMRKADTTDNMMKNHR